MSQWAAVVLFDTEEDARAWARSGRADYYVTRWVPPVIERMIQSAERDQERSLARMADGRPFPASVRVAALRAALNGDAFLTDSGTLVINRSEDA